MTQVIPGIAANKCALSRVRIVPEGERQINVAKQSINQVAKIVFSILALSFLVASLTRPIKAQYYGSNEEVKQLIVDKTIKGLDKGEWKDNYSSSEMIFGPNTVFDYKIVIKNDGNRNQTWIKVTDTLPSYLTILFGYNPDKGDTYNSQTREIVYKIPEIKPGEENSRVVRVKVKGENDVPKATTEIVNKVYIKAESGLEDDDIAKAYIGSGKQTVSQLPATGNREIVIGSLIGLSIVGLAIILRKIGRGEFLNK